MNELELTPARIHALETADPACKRILDYGESISYTSLNTIIESITDPVLKEDCLQRLVETGTTTQDFLTALKASVGSNPPAPINSPAVTPPAQSAGTPGALTEQQKAAEAARVANLPLAPTTAFNVMRLIQLGFFPTDYSESMKKPWSEYKWGLLRKANQSVYVNAGNLARASESFSDNFWLSIFNKSEYGPAMRDVLAGMQKELDAWHKQNKMPEARYKEAKDAIERANTAFGAGKYDEMMSHVNEATKKLSLNVDGTWHTKTDAERAAERTRLQGEIAAEQGKINATQRAQKHSEENTKKRTEKTTNLGTEITTLQNNHGFGNELVTGKEAIANIDRRIGAIIRETQLLTNDPYNRTHDGKVAGYHNDLPLLHSDARQAILVIEPALLANGRELANGTISGNAGNPLELAKNNYENAKFATLGASKTDKTTMMMAEQQAKAAYESLKKQGDSLYRILEYRRAVEQRIVDLNTEKTMLENELKPKIVEREKLASHNKKAEEARTKLQEKQTKQTSSLTEKTGIYTEATGILDKLNNPALGAKEKENLNSRLTELIGAKNPEAQRILTTLATAPKDASGNPARTQAITELRGIVDKQESAFNKVKSKLDASQSAIDAQRTKITETIKKYDDAARNAQAKGDIAELERIREESARVIKQEAVFIDDMNVKNRVDFDTAKVSISPLHYNRLIGSSKVAEVFDKLEKFNGVMENGTKAPGKIMRFGYGALMLAGIGQIGMTAANDRVKAAKYAGDMAAGFIPFGIGGMYDIGMGIHQFFMGEHAMTGDKVSRTDAVVRAGFGVLGVVTFGASNIIKGAVKAEKAYDFAKATMTTSKAISHGYILYETPHLGYALWDAGESFLRNPQETYSALKKNQDMPYQRDWHVFTVPGNVYDRAGNKQ